jgi:hypothetical protein
MKFRPATTRVIKPGRSSNPFVLFTGSRKHSEDSSGEPFSTFLTTALLALVAALIFGCIYAFVKGKIG